MSQFKKWTKIILSICGGWLSLMSGALSVPIGALAIYFGGKPGIWLAVLAFVALWGFVIGVVRKNYQMMETANSVAEKHARELSELKLSFEDQINQLKQPSVAIEYTTVRLKTHGNANSIPIRVLNISTSKSLNSVRAELCYIQDSPDNSPATSPQLPLRLLTKDGADSASIHPGGMEEFILFKLITVNPAVIGQMLTQIVTAFFRKPNGDSNMLTFGTNENNRIKIRVTADNTPAVIVEFNIKITENESDIRFTLTEVQ